MNDADITAALRPYAAPLPTDFQHALLQCLAPPASPPRPRWPLIAIPAALAAAVAFTALLTIRWNPHPSEIPAFTSQLPPALPAPIPTMMGMLTLDAQMSRAPLIVRTRITNITGWNVEFTLTRIIFGHTDNLSFTLDVTFGNPSLAKSSEDNARQQFLKDNHRDPTPEELHTAALLQQGIALDRQVILMLQPTDKPGQYRSLGMQFNAPPDHTLDNAEKEMMRVIAAGSYLTPVTYTGDVFYPQVDSASAIVRAKLLQVTPNDSRWQIIRTAKGALTTDTLTLDHSQFHDRAEALINYAALTDPSLRSDTNRAAAIQSKMTDLLKSDLTPNREAILFLGPLQADPTTTHAPLQHLLYATDNAQNLDHLEALLRSPQTLPSNL